MNKINAERLDLMGIGTPESERTHSQRRLATIILTQPIERLFDGRPDAYELWRLQQRFFEQRYAFIGCKDERKLRGIAAALLKNDRTLARCTVGWDLGRGRRGGFLDQRPAE